MKLKAWKAKGILIKKTYLCIKEFIELSNEQVGPKERKIKEENPNTFGKGSSPNMKCFYSQPPHTSHNYLNQLKISN